MSQAQIVQHKHCISCGRAIQVDESFCADECKTLYDQRQQKKLRNLYVYFFGMVVVMGLAILNL